MKKEQKQTKNLPSLEKTQDIMGFLQQPALKIAEAITGILSSDKKDLKLSTGQLVQAAIKCNLLTQLGEEIKVYRNKGKIRENYLKSDINRATFKELLSFIDDESPDDVRFKAIKSIFISSIEKGVDAKGEMLAYQIMQICKKLSSAEILILKANYQLVKNENYFAGKGVDFENARVSNWSQVVAGQIGHGLSELVLQYETHLIDLRLISDYQYSSGQKTRVETNFSKTSYYRLTELGYELCKFIIQYE